MRGLLFVACVSWLLGFPVVAAAQVKLGEPSEDSHKAREEAVKLAKHELSVKLAVPKTALQLVSAVEVKWPDASLGCPEKDRMYAQMLTRGWKVILEQADGSRHEVHVAGKRAVFCRAADKRQGG